jgi:hypothetical protein
MELIFDFPCETKGELYREEGIYIRERVCVSKNFAGQTYIGRLKT